MAPPLKSSARARRRNLLLGFVIIFSSAYLLRKYFTAEGPIENQTALLHHHSSSLSGSGTQGLERSHGIVESSREDHVNDDASSHLGHAAERSAVQRATGRDSEVPVIRASQAGFQFKTAKKVKGNARPDLLFELECTPEHVQSCSAQGVGPSRTKMASKVDYVTKGALTERAPGGGGPSGCKEAWITALGNDGFLPAVLVLLHTIRKYAKEDRDFIALVSSAVSEPVRQRLAEEAVRVIVVDPFENNERARQLVSKSARYRSGYWVVKMFVWRFEEYTKMVYVDADMYVRQNTDTIFCSPTDHAKYVIAVTPRSSFDANAGFNAGMFIYNPSNAVFDSIMAKFLALSQGEMLATSEQDFLNGHFKDHYFLIPIDYIMKHRRMVKERKLWDENRVHGYHMNGSPKPWEPQWRTACAYPKDHQKLLKQYEDFFVEWWSYYYDMIGLSLPADRNSFRLLPEHDPGNSFDEFLSSYKCPENPK